MIADRQTHRHRHTCTLRQTDTLIAILRSFIGGGVSLINPKRVNWITCVQITWTRWHWECNVNLALESSHHRIYNSVDFRIFPPHIWRLYGTRILQKKLVVHSIAFLEKLVELPRIVQLIKSKCFPVLYYGLEACSLRKYQYKSINYVINSTARKIFNTWSQETVDVCLVVSRLSGQLRYANASFWTNLVLYVTHCAWYSLPSLRQNLNHVARTSSCD